MNNEDGKHVYVRHHNTWKFDFADFDVQVEKVDRPGFLSDRDWEHFSTVKSEPIVTQPPNYYASALLQWDRPELRPTWTDASYLDYPHYPLYPPIPSGLVVAEFNLTVPVVTISQSGGEATQQVIDLNLVSLEEIDDATALQDIDLQTVGWMMEQNNGSAPGGDITETIFTSHLGTVTSGANNATIQYLFNTFGSDELITTGSNYSFTVTPALLKFSLNVASWKWNSTSGKLRLTIKIDPPFVSFTRWDDTPQVGMTTFLFSSATADQASTVVRLLNFGEALGESPSRVSMEASAEVTSSSLSLTFDHFNDTLSFDPGRRCLACYSCCWVLTIWWGGRYWTVAGQPRRKWSRGKQRQLGPHHRRVRDDTTSSCIRRVVHLRGVSGGCAQAQSGASQEQRSDCL